MALIQLLRPIAIVREGGDCFFSAARDFQIQGTAGRLYFHTLLICVVSLFAPFLAFLQAFEHSDYALLVGSKPRGPGQERADLLNENGCVGARRVCMLMMYATQMGIHFSPSRSLRIV